jgi:hypothetical protein
MIATDDRVQGRSFLRILSATNLLVCAVPLLISAFASVTPSLPKR